MDRPLTALLLVALSLAASPRAQDRDPGWLLVSGSARGYGGLSPQRIAEIYLRGAGCEIVAGDRAPASPATHRLLIGTPADNAALAACLGELGVTTAADRLRYRGRPIDAGTGLALVADDPDGAGRLVLMTGVDADGVGACLSVPVDLGRNGFTIARAGRVLQRGSAALEFDTSAVLVVRLDRDFDHLRDSAAGAARADAIVRLARGLAGYRFVFEAAFHPGIDMMELMQQQSASATVAKTRERFAGADIEALIGGVHTRCDRLLGPREGPQPVYYVLYGDAHGTNAQNFDDEPDSGRRRVLLNLCRMQDLGELESVALHETVHTFQRTFGRRLAERAVTEGVATLLTQELRPETGDAQALMWSDADLQAAQAHRRELIAVFLRYANATNDDVCGQFLRADRRLDELPATPPRCAYYIGWLAAKAWRAVHATATARDLLAADATDVLATLR